LPFCGLPEGNVNLLKNHRLWRVVLTAMLAPLAFIAFWPSPVDQPVAGQLAAVLNFLHLHGIPAWVNYGFVEASANVALFVPLGVVSSLAFPHWSWWRVGVLGLLISCCMELGQLLFLHNRFPSPLDLVTNSSGAVIGALLAATAFKKVQVRCLPAADL
jgi:glycopeptide antibiotics resistance protein